MCVRGPEGDNCTKAPKRTEHSQLLPFLKVQECTVSAAADSQPAADGQPAGSSIMEW
jgi:hypothetical protein